LVAGAIVGVLSAVGLLVLHADAPQLFDELTSGRALPFLILSIVAGLASLGLLWRRRYLAVRLTAALAVVGLLWGWAAGQYPRLLPGLALDQAAATHTVLVATLAALGGGALLLVPSLWWLYATFQRGHESSTPVPPR
jgi:cytochrome d ubiquinol oxidase subunit II